MQSKSLKPNISNDSQFSIAKKTQAYQATQPTKGSNPTKMVILYNDSKILILFYRQTPSQLLKKQASGNVLEELNQKPKIVQFLNIADLSSYTESAVSIDEPLFEPIPTTIQFTDYEPLQIKDKIFRLRNKDRYARRVKIIPPDSRLFQVLPYNKSSTLKGDFVDGDITAGSKVLLFFLLIRCLIATIRLLLAEKSLLSCDSALRQRSITRLIS